MTTAPTPDPARLPAPAPGITHHLTDSLLLAYSAGQLSEAFSLVVATHVSLCDECRARAEAFDAVGGSVLEHCEAAPLAEGCFAAVLRRIAAMPAPAADERPIRVAERCAAGLPQPLAGYVGRELADVRWRPIGMGVRQAVLPTGKGATARLLYIPAGAAMPDHGHRGIELTLVLQGAFRDEVDRFGPGDIEIADSVVEHRPVAEAGAACICLIATDAPLRFSGLLPRMAQPFFRI